MDSQLAIILEYKKRVQEKEIEDNNRRKEDWLHSVFVQLDSEITGLLDKIKTLSNEIQLGNCPSLETITENIRMLQIYTTPMPKSFTKSELEEKIKEKVKEKLSFLKTTVYLSQIQYASQLITIQCSLE